MAMTIPTPDVLAFLSPQQSQVSHCMEGASQRRSSEPIHSRGTGRSGPKRKTGCLTCRRRKVRCDETRPTCNNCIRLRLDCGYVEPKTKSTEQSSPVATIAYSTVRRTSSVSDHQSGLTNGIEPQQLPATCSGMQPMPVLPPTTHADQSQTWNYGNAVNDGAFPFTSPYQDVVFSTLDTFDTGLGFPTSDVSWSQEHYANAAEHLVANGRQSGVLQTPVGTGMVIEDENRRKALIEHFVRYANPLSVVLPNHTEWTSACRNLLAMANDSAFLMSAMLALSSLHLHATKGEESFDGAFRLYRASSREVNNVLDQAHVDDRQLKAAFASLFLLSHAELMAQTTAKAERNYWPLQHLQSAHHRVRQYSEQIRLWTGTSKRILMWLNMLQAKAEWNCGSPALQHTSAALSKSIGDPFARNAHTAPSVVAPTGAHSNENGCSVKADSTLAFDEENSRTISELVYDTVNQPGLDFFLKCQSFTSRIVSLDEYHRKRGTFEAEFETLKDGQRISVDLHQLWATRPTTLAFLEDAKALEAALKPTLAKQILLNLRVYVANFYAQFIYLHRVAFKIYPASGDVEIAVSRIIRLAKSIVDWVEEHRRSLSSPPSRLPTPRQSQAELNVADNPGNAVLEEETGTKTAALPATMLWPLFLAALECSIPDRLWLVQAMREMDARHVPNAARTVFLLEEVLRRQDQEGRRVDHRSVRKELFDGELSVLY